MTRDYIRDNLFNLLISALLGILVIIAGYICQKTLANETRIWQLEHKNPGIEERLNGIEKRIEYMEKNLSQQIKDLKETFKEMQK
jgi:hypothetical protein